MKYLIIYYSQSGYIVSNNPILDPWEALDQVSDLDTEIFSWSISGTPVKLGY